MDNIKRLDNVIHRGIEAYERYSADIFSKELLNFSSVEIKVIRFIYENPEIKVKAISNYLGVSNSTLTSILDRLERKEILTRNINSKDKRSFVLVLTEFGERIYLDHMNGEEKFWKLVLDTYSTEDQDKLIKLLEMFVEKLDVGYLEQGEHNGQN